jgi:hypothetical protein
VPRYSFSVTRQRVLPKGVFLTFSPQDAAVQPQMTKQAIASFNNDEFSFGVRRQRA